MYNCIPYINRNNNTSTYENSYVRNNLLPDAPLTLDITLIGYYEITISAINEYIQK